MNPKFSIIIPVYNVAPYLRECLESLLTQTYTSWEAICVDDGSTDGSGAILDEYAERYDSGQWVVGSGLRFKVIHQTNQGVSAARNRGLEEASGDWILFLDGDDVWHPETLKVCSEMIAADAKADIVHFTRFRFPDGEVPKFGDVDRNFKMRNLDDGIIGDDLAYSFSTFCMRREVATVERFPMYVVGEDLIYRSRCLQRAKRIVSTTSAFLAYRTRLGSATNSHFSWRKYRDRIAFTSHWLGMVVVSPRPYPKLIWWRLVKNLIRAILNLG